MNGRFSNLTPNVDGTDAKFGSGGNEFTLRIVRYIDIAKSGSDSWYIYYKMPQYMTDSGIFRKKLAARAKSAEILAFPEPHEKEKNKYYVANAGGASKLSVEAIMRILP